ncbi:hypothetical protein JTL59_34255, partial [Pseudomonas aeruginosa]|nr:hypothetical protein [Pseudomonas aeruginosa]
NARIWYISPQEPHNKTAYFVDAPYQVDKISEQTFADWQHKSQAIQLQLPALNPYIPDDFTLIKSDKAWPHPQLILDEPTNDLDVETLELLEELIDGYQGTVMLVSHDRQFVDNTVTECWIFEGGGRIGQYVGGYHDARGQQA